MKENAKWYLIYGWLWIWLLLVSAISVFVFKEAFGIAAIALADIPGVSNAIDAKATSWLASFLVILGGLLFWWRMVKVLVLHGAPFTFGMEVSDGRQNGGIGGRRATMVFVGDHNAYPQSYDGVFLLGVVFRAHPSSDKLMRSRMELLIAALPFERSLVIAESRIWVLKETHRERAIHYRNHADNYTEKVERKTPDSFRHDVAGSAKAVSDYFKGRSSTKRIDGLVWQQFVGGEWQISDDFGFHISCVRLEDGRYKVTDLGDNANGEKIVDTIAQVREIATADLNPS